MSIAFESTPQAKQAIKLRVHYGLTKVRPTPKQPRREDSSEPDSTSYTNDPSTRSLPQRPAPSIMEEFLAKFDLRSLKKVIVNYRTRSGGVPFSV